MLCVLGLQFLFIQKAYAQVAEQLDNIGSKKYSGAILKKNLQIVIITFYY